MKRCLLCNAKNVSKKVSIKQYVLYECHVCSVVFTIPHGNMRDNALINAKRYDSVEEEKEYLKHYTRLSKRATTFARQIRRVKKSGKLLDIGCSYGIYLEAAQKAGFEVYGVETAKRAATYIQKKMGLSVFHGTLEEAHYPSATFDVITAYDVIEHIPNVQAFLLEARRILKKDGIFVIQCPNIESVAVRLLGKNWNWLVIPNHLWHFSPKSLSHLLELSRFKIVLTSTWDDVEDLADNMVSSVNLYATNKYSSFAYKLMKRMLVVVIYPASFVWCRLRNGGAIRIYAIKA